MTWDSDAVGTVRGCSGTANVPSGLWEAVTHAGLLILPCAGSQFASQRSNISSKRSSAVVSAVCSEETDDAVPVKKVEMCMRSSVVKAVFFW